MYLRERDSGDYVEVLDYKALVDPCQTSISGRFHAGEELQDAEEFDKSDLVFPSGENLPACWLDADYKEKMA
ncbi:MAG: acetyltransferase [Gammaproteobacteria bacterium]